MSEEKTCYQESEAAAVAAGIKGETEGFFLFFGRTQWDTFVPNGFGKKSILHQGLLGAYLRPWLQGYLISLVYHIVHQISTAPLHFTIL